MTGLTARGGNNWAAVGNTDSPLYWFLTTYGGHRTLAIVETRNRACKKKIQSNKYYDQKNTTPFIVSRSPPLPPNAVRESRESGDLGGEGPGDLIGQFLGKAFLPAA